MMSFGMSIAVIKSFLGFGEMFIGHRFGLCCAKNDTYATKNENEKSKSSCADKKKEDKNEDYEPSLACNLEQNHL